jgi:hypothetical protein
MGGRHVTGPNTFTGVRCNFWARTPVDGGYRYDRISISGPGDASAGIRTTMPPAVGDLIWLSTTYRVIERAWQYPTFGSLNFPSDGQIVDGPAMDVIVEHAVGPFVHEVQNEDGDDE